MADLNDQLDERGKDTSWPLTDNKTRKFKRADPTGTQNSESSSPVAAVATRTWGSRGEITPP